MVDRGKDAPVAAKVEAIHRYPTPTNRNEAMRFLGMAGFYRRFCPNFVNVAASLSNLVSPKEPFLWTNECQDALDRSELSDYISTASDPGLQPILQSAM